LLGCQELFKNFFPAVQSASRARSSGLYYRASLHWGRRSGISPARSPQLKDPGALDGQ